MIRTWINNTKKFFADTWAEMCRCVWPGKEQLVEQTLLVIVVIVILSLFVALVDSVSGFVITNVTGGN